MRSVCQFALLAGCGGAHVVSGAPVAPATSGSAPAHTFVERPPGPITGAWRVLCPENAGEIIEFKVVNGEAVGRVPEPGDATKYGFSKGEEIFHLKPNDGHGDWLGTVLWRGVAGTTHWDSIRFTATATVLDATMTNEPCYRNMPRVR